MIMAGECSLEHLRTVPTEQIKKVLCSFSGVGPKTASCVLMFCLGRAEFPVDTHVWKIAKGMKWVGASLTRNQTYDFMNEVVPPSISYVTTESDAIFFR